MTSVRRQHGYRKVDHRASGGTLDECDILCCKHCQAILFLPPHPKATNNGWCRLCKAPVCGVGACAERTAQGGCNPFQKQIDAEAEQSYRREQLIRAMGFQGAVQRR
jgi:hypothetical protein